MANISLIIIVALTMLLMGFFFAMRLSPFSNVSWISKQFVQYRWPTSAVIGTISGAFFLPLLDPVGGLASEIITGLVMLVAATVSAYLGITLGWRPASQPNLTSEALQLHQLPTHITIDNSFQGVTITINTKIQGGMLISFLIQALTLGIFVLPILAHLLNTLLQNFLPENYALITWMVISIPGLALLYGSFYVIREILTTREVIAIDKQAVSITKHVLGFQYQTQYPADNIVKILPALPEVNASRWQHGFSVSHPRGILRVHAFGKSVSLTDAHKILETVYKRFPQYKG